VAGRDTRQDQAPDRCHKGIDGMVSWCGGFRHELARLRPMKGTRTRTGRRARARRRTSPPDRKVNGRNHQTDGYGLHDR